MLAGWIWFEMKFSRNETVVHKEESVKQLSVRPWTRLRWLRPLLDANRPIPETQNEKKKKRVDDVGAKSRAITEWQGAILFRRFSVQHFSRFALNNDDVEYDIYEETSIETLLSRAEFAHTLPAHLSLDPARTKVMEPLMFPNPCWGRVGISWIKLSHCRLCIRSNSGGLRILWTSILYC